MAAKRAKDVAEAEYVTSKEFHGIMGHGLLKGRLDIREDIDLTKPTWEQVYGAEAIRKAAKKAASHGANSAKAALRG